MNTLWVIILLSDPRIYITLGILWVVIFGCSAFLAIYIPVWYAWRAVVEYIERAPQRKGRQNKI